jgi:IS605 OrfB family transposase
MTQVTIQSRLVASEATRQHLWMLMADLNTPLINHLLEQINHHPDFLAWRQKGKIPAGTIKQLCQSLRSDPRYSGQPGRFYISAITLVDYIYKSWLKLQKRLQQRLEGQQRWLDMLKSDADLSEISGCSLDILRQRAAEILQGANPNHPESSTLPPSRKRHKAKQSEISDTHPNFSQALFVAYRETEDAKTRAAIAYLLKNGCKLPEKPEDPKKFAKRRRKVEIQIQRLTEQLEGRMPKGRDLTNTQWLEALEMATKTAPQNEAQAKSWQDSLLRESSNLPFPVAYETNTDLTWLRNGQGRLCVRFNGLGDHLFQVYCDRRQLHWFERFLEDQQVQKDSKDKHSSGLFTLRSARISWQEGKGKGHPWQIHRLVLQCSLDTRLWTQEGTEQVRDEKVADIAKILTNMKGKGDLNDQQQAFIKRKHSTLARINNAFPRPSKPLYQGQSQILVGISLGLKQPATAAVIDAATGKVLAYRTIRQLLGENYRLLNRQRQQQHNHAHQRQTAQRQGNARVFSESELGQYVDRLLAEAIIELAKTYCAGSIVVPKLGDVRERVQSEVQARAEQICPNLLEGQQNYAKQYRSTIHRWSYGRLIDQIRSKANRTGIEVEEGQQPIKGTPQEIARDLAITAYHARTKVI